MRNKTVVTGCIIFFFLLTTGNLNAMQPAKNNHVDPPQQEELDKAFLRIIYVFDQQATKEEEKILVTDSMALDIAQNWSVYYDWNKEQRDSVAKVKDQKLIQTLKSVNVLKDPDNEIFERFEAMNRKPDIMNDRKGEDARIFKNRSDNTIITIDKGPFTGAGKGIYLRLKEQIPPMDWQISEDTISIMGYLCYKATVPFRGRNYTAWFSPEIPVNEGPWKLYGLPGAILDAKTEDGLFRFQAIGIEQIKDVPIRFPSDRDFEEAKTLKQVNDYRRSKLKDISLSYMDNGTMTILRKRNPVEYNDLELSE